MFKLYSKGCQYALRALTFASAAAPGTRFQARDLCEKAEIPEPITRKVFQALTQGGFLQAHRGPGGGYSLTRDPAEITLLEVIQAVEGKDTFDGCVLGFSECGQANPCPMHHIWVSTKKNLLENLSSTTLSELTALTLRRKLRHEHHARPKARPAGKRAPRKRAAG
jgi:Rrf2 family protein